MSDAHAFDTILGERLEGGAMIRLTLNQPKANILSMAMMADLGKALDIHRDDPELRLVVIRGAGRAFSFGASVAEHTRDKAPAMLAAFHAFSRKVAGYPVPILAAVDGPCLGGAFELALLCHFVIATERSVFACPEIKLGVFPPVLAAIGHLRLGGATAERLLLTGANMSAAEAQRIGWLAQLTDTDVNLDDAVQTWYSEHVAGLSAFTMRQAVRVSRRSSGMLAALGATLDEAERQYVEEVVSSHDGNEGIEAFLERRKADWRHN